MSSSSLDPENLPVAPDRSLGRGHDNGSLGPSDTSDSGSDVRGGKPSTRKSESGLREGEAENAGDDQLDDVLDAFKGDGELDSDSDSGGTGERGGVERGESSRAGRDINTDHIQNENDAQDDADPSS